MHIGNSYGVQRLDVGSIQMMDRGLMICPDCRGIAVPTFLRAGFSRFIAALVCVQCRTVYRAGNAFELVDGD